MVVQMLVIISNDKSQLVGALDCVCEALNRGIAHGGQDVSTYFRQSKLVST